MASIVLAGSSSGSVTVAAPAAAGSTTLTLPAVTGTVITTTSPKAGNIIQVVQTVKTDIFTTTSTSFVDVTGFTASITPSSSSSKILISATTSNSASTTGGLVVYNLLRGSTNISQPATTPTFNGTMGTYATVVGALIPISINFLDSPSTTSATTYKIQLRTNSGTCFLNGRSIGDSAFTSTLTLMEVAA